LALELDPSTYKGVSTSSIFIQSTDGKRELRLDWGFNKRTGNIDYHWNQRGVFAKFGIQGHTEAGVLGRYLWHGARIFKWAGRALFVAGAVMDGVSIVRAENKVRQTAVVVGGFAGAWAGAKLLGAGGAFAGSAVPGPGTIIGGFVGATGGAIGGFFLARWAAAKVYDTVFTPLPEETVTPW
jgi:hypothetical protein